MQRGRSQVSQVSRVSRVSRGSSVSSALVPAPRGWFGAMEQDRSGRLSHFPSGFHAAEAFGAAPRPTLDTRTAAALVLCGVRGWMFPTAFLLFCFDP